jgi:glycosyltransferase involved in cell wall biosynthesis
MEPLISVVTVALNAAKTISDTLASVALQQASFPFEHLVVDGGSTDGTRALIDHWATPSRQIVRIYEPDRGIYDAMNKGLQAANGEYVLFLNADDFLVSADTLAMAMAGVGAGEEHSPALLVGDAVMGKLGTVGIWRRRRVPRLLGRLRGFGLYPVHQGQFTKRKLLLAIGGFDARLRLAADLTQYYDLERKLHPTTRLLRRDVAFMQAGGAANAGLRAIRIGSMECFHHLAAHYSRLRATAMVVVKTCQSLSEIRYGRCPHQRWFATTPDFPAATQLTGLGMKK